MPTGRPVTDEQELMALTAKDTAFQRPVQPITLLAIVWPLISHAILAIGMAVFMLHYVHDRDFNIEDRSPVIQLPDGKLQNTGYALLQSDITTIVSILLALLRLILGCWLGQLGWRCAYILLETVGLTHRQLSTVVSYGVPRFTFTKRKATCIVICLILGLALPVNIFAPVLTGSITWKASNRLTSHISDPPVTVRTVTRANGWNAGWNLYNSTRERPARVAAGSASIAWNKGSQYEPGWSKRVLRSYDTLGKESRLDNITLPYFEIHSLEWIADPSKTLTPEQLDVYSLPCDHARLVKERSCPLEETPGALGLIPNSALPPDTEPFPERRIIRERRLMVLQTHWRLSGAPCTNPNTERWISDEFPPGAGLYSAKEKGECWAFAWVNFTAGVANCSNCRVSSFATVQNEGTLTVLEDHMTGPTLRLMPTVISVMALMNSSLPSPWRNVDHYVREALGRSYAVSWDALVDWLGESEPKLETGFSPSVPSSRAQVEPIRVYLWLIIQLLVTLSGAIFLLLQDRLRSSPVKDTILEPFYLDTTPFYEADGGEKIWSDGIIRLEFEDGRRKLKVD